MESILKNLDKRKELTHYKLIQVCKGSCISLGYNISEL